MKADDWQEVKTIFNSAIELGPGARADYLNKICDGDDSLRRKVEEMLSSYQTDFLEPDATGRNGSEPADKDLLKPGDKIGRYEVVRLLGVGGMGEVYLARDASLDRFACVKVFSADTASSRMQLERFVREAQSASALNHPHICTIYEIDREHDPPFIAMEYIEGRTLADVIASGELEPHTAIDLALQIAHGLAEAHDAGIVHRDIKPANIVINKRGDAKILDFGLAKRVTAELDEKTQEKLSISGMIMGTVSYMSPEQVKGEKIDARSDIFSFGVLLYEMITGRRPFHGNSTAETMAKILTADPAPIPSPNISSLEELIGHCLEKDKTHRIESISRVIKELKAIDLSDIEQRVRIDQQPPTVRMGRTGATPSAAWDLYMRGKVRAASENREDVEGAIALLEEAVELKPDLAEAYAALAQAYTTKAFQFAADDEKKEIAENAEVAVEKALALNPDLAEGHFARGVILWTLAKRFPHDQAIQSHKRAIELDPNLDEAHHRLGLIYFHVGLLDQARDEVKKALAINPNNTMARFRLGTIDAHQGKFEDAIAIFKTIPRDISPAIVDRAMADALVNLGRLEDAEALVDDYLKRYPHDEGGNVTSVKAVLLARAGKREEAQAMIRRAVDLGRGYGHFHHTAVNIAAAYAILNDRVEAVRWLRDAADNGFPCCRYFEVNPNFDSIRNDPEFIAFISDIRRVYERRLRIQQPTEPQTTEANPATRSAHSLSGLGFASGRPIAAIVLAFLVIAAIGVTVWLYYSRPAAAPIDSIAVMPLSNQTGNPESEYLSDGITESLIGRLSQIPNLSVMARSSVFRFKGKDVGPKEIGKDLNVPAILTGRVSRNGNTFSLYIELVDAVTEKVMWSAEYNRPESNLTTIPGEIARDVAENLRKKLSGADEQKITQTYTDNSTAYELYLKGRYYWDRRNEESYKIAEDAYKQAIDLDPNYALAYAGLADLYLFRDDKLNRHIAMPLAKQNALKALELDETLAEAHNTLAFVNENYDLDMPAAEAGFRRAIELKPNYAIAHQWYSGLLMWTGRTEEALAEAKLAVELEPYSAAVNWGYGGLLMNAGRYEEAIAQEQKTLQILPNYPLAETTLADIYTLTRKYPDALQLLNKLTLNPERRGENLAKIARVYALTDRRRESQKILRELLGDESTLERVGGYRIAWVYAALGDKDQAFRWLNKAYEDRAFHMMFLRADPFFESLHGDPRYEELIRRIGLQN